MRNVTLHRLLESFTVDASSRLCAESAAGAEMPFELAEERGSGRVPLYCYRPLVDEFIRSRMASLGDLPSHADAVGALARCEALDVYLSEHGVKPPPDPRGCAHAALGVFLESVFTERSAFGFEPAAFESAYAELERAIYEGHCTATVIAPLVGVALDPDTIELTLGDGLSLIRGDALADAPPEAVWGESDEPNVLALLAIDEGGSGRPPVAVARTRFRQVLSALRLFERGGYAVGPLGWARTEAGSWRPVTIGVAGRPRLLTIVPAAQEDELRAFCRLVARREPHPELAWALARYEMGCERPAPVEALTDYLLALRALLEPEGPASGRLAQRLAVICGRPEDRVALTERTARAVALERSAIGGLAGNTRDPARPDPLIDELAENLRAILRDMLCGHLEADLVSVADELLAEATDRSEADSPDPAAGVR
ncbi:MAG TPA: hypothetical protein VHV28_14325 [Solirubrobacteraceae bacterium]|nr:hypothetical protein [Solirubrobacteraceae bacterium]